VAECGDLGDPIVHKYPDSVIAKAYRTLAETVTQELQQSGQQPGLPGLQF
jgi:hypothetical protein